MLPILYFFENNTPSLFYFIAFSNLDRYFFYLLLTKIPNSRCMIVALNIYVQNVIYKILIPIMIPYIAKSNFKLFTYNF